MHIPSIDRQRGDDIVGCCCDYNKGRLGFIVHCGATNQQQMPRAKGACLHLLRMSRLQRLPITKGQDAIYNERG